MNSKWLFLNLFGLIALLTFTVFTFISVALYPIPYSLLYDWQSNLGNITLNPSGALLFNWGCIITGLILIPFIITFYRWNKASQWRKILLILVIILGVFAAISLIGVGLFPETHIKLHVLAATSVFESMFFIIILLTITFYKHPKFMHLVAYWGILAVLIDGTFMITLSLPKYHNALAGFHPTVPIPGREWAAIYSSMIWIGLLSYNMYKNRV